MASMMVNVHFRARAASGVSSDAELLPKVLRRRFTTMGQKTPPMEEPEMARPRARARRLSNHSETALMAG